jgi:3-hydroxybutyrate dehydrogenase
MSEQRAYLVTGAASGIGRAIAARLSDDGHQVLSVDRAPDPDGPGRLFAADLTRREANQAAVAAAMAEFGRLDGVVACAGFQVVAPVQEFPEDRWDDLIAVLLTSPFLLARYAWQPLMDSGDGRFVAIASVHGLVASPFKAAYVSAKHGVLGLVKTLALEGAPYGIVSVAVCPGYVRTPLVERQIDDQARAHGIPAAEVLERVMLTRQARKQLIEPADVADTVAFLISPAGRSYTGSQLVMGNGWTAG